MTRSTIAKSMAGLAVLAPVGAGALGAPAIAANSGGAGSEPTPSGPTTQAPPATRIPMIVTSPGPVSLRVRAVGMLGGGMNFRGVVPRGDAGKTVSVELLDATSGAWVTIASSVANRRGSFVAHWQTNVVGRLTARAVVATGSSAADRGGPASGSASSAPAEFTVYQSAYATYFGDGFYGQQTACGELMTHRLLGVANRTLPCGTLVEVEYGSARLTVPVVDRGTYANGANWDLTQATATALGIDTSVTIGTIVLGGPPPSPSAIAPIFSPQAGGVVASG